MIKWMEKKLKWTDGGLEMNIFVLYGGKSAEHDVSIISAYNILKEVYYQ